MKRANKVWMNTPSELTTNPQENLITPGQSNTPITNIPKEPVIMKKQSVVNYNQSNINPSTNSTVENGNDSTLGSSTQIDPNATNSTTMNQGNGSSLNGSYGGMGGYGSYGGMGGYGSYGGMGGYGGMYGGGYGGYGGYGGMYGGYGMRGMYGGYGMNGPQDKSDFLDSCFMTIER